MYPCKYEIRVGGQGCPNEQALDFDFCPQHLNTPRGKQHAMEVIAAGNLTLPSHVQFAIEQATQIPDEDYQTSALEKMSHGLTIIQDWVDEARRNLDGLGGNEQWRYKDRAGQEQMRTELGVYERALDRLSRHLSAMSKVAVQEKIVTLGKAQVELMIRLLMAVISELKLDPQLSDKAKYTLLEKLENDANLIPSVEKHARERLVIPGQVTHVA